MPRRLETLAEQEVKMNTIHQNQMTGGYRPFQETGDDSEENNESCKEKEFYGLLMMVSLNSESRRRE